MFPNSNPNTAQVTLGPGSVERLIAGLTGTATEKGHTGYALDGASLTVRPDGWGVLHGAPERVYALSRG